MLNSISLVGKIVKNVYHVENMAFIDIEVKRPFPEEIGKEKFDVFSIALWKGLEDMMSDVAQIGMIIAVRGRLQWLIMILKKWLYMENSLKF